jgi:disulfide bond formation protein DsbB
MMPYVFCAIPVVAFLYAALKWRFRTLMASLIFLQVAIGVYNARMDHVWLITEAQAVTSENV